jgi:hypothetical protein
MQPPRKREGADGRPRLSVVISELRSRESGMDRERKRRLADGDTSLADDQACSYRGRPEGLLVSSQ